MYFIMVYIEPNNNPDTHKVSHCFESSTIYEDLNGVTIYHIYT